MDLNTSLYLVQEWNDFTMTKKIVLLDFCSEKNRGDAAMQVGILKLVFRYFYEPMISIISVFGANQSNNLINEYDHSKSWPVRILGGLKPTYYPISDTKSKPVFVFEILNAVMFIFDIVLLLLLGLKTPIFIIKYLIPRVYHDSIDELVQADLVIWKGRNFRSRDNLFIEIYRTMHVVFHPLVCFALNKPVACVGASLWHLNNPFSRMILRYTFNKCQSISFREKNSFDEARKLIGDKSKTELLLLPDLSFVIYDDGRLIKAQRNPIPNTEYPQTVGITVVDWNGEGNSVREKYKNALSGTIQFLLNKGVKIKIIPQVTKNWETSHNMTAEIISEQVDSQNISIIEGEPQVKDLLLIYSKLDFLIATRMHSAIFASMVGTPLAIISYDKGGKWSILQELGYSEYMINYSDATLESIISKISGCWKERDVMLQVVEHNINTNFRNVDQNISALL